MKINENPSNSMQITENQFKLMNINGNQWKSNEINTIPADILENPKKLIGIGRQ